VASATIVGGAPAIVTNGLVLKVAICELLFNPIKKKTIT